MRQLLPFSLPAFATMAFLISCGLSNRCGDLSGHWSTREGQDFVFQPDGKALWLTRFGSRFDTNLIQYRTVCVSGSLIHVDLYDFRSGPFLGKTLYGLLEWTSDSSFRLRYEPGIQPEVRPTSFDQAQSVQYWRK